jgi:ATP-binding cassette subfamily B multidrug efflux pump
MSTSGICPTSRCCAASSLSIPAGQSVAIVGPTGAGKSSLVSLMARQYDPRQGVIRLDDVDIERFALRDLRRAVAVVPQDPVCLAGSIAFNIRLYRDDLSDDDVRRAAEFSNAARFIEEFAGQLRFPGVAQWREPLTRAAAVAGVGAGVGAQPRRSADPG